MSVTSTTTNRSSLKTLAKSILNRLENNKYIIFDAKDRGELQEDFYRKLHQFVLTEEDINDQVRSQVAANAEALSEKNLNESDAFQSQKKSLKARMGENQLNGFYFQETLRGVGVRVCKFLFESPLVEDVFESDEAIQKLVLETIQNFDESKIS